MSAFWDAWRKEIIRGATLFGAVLVLFFLVRYAVVIALPGLILSLVALVASVARIFL